MRGIFGLSFQHHLMAGAAIVAVANGSPAEAQTRKFDVPAEAAAQGIPAFAKQAGVQIIASGNVVRDRRTSAVRGPYTVEEGLRRLLSGTGLTAAPPGQTGIITIVQSAEGNGGAAGEAASILEEAVGGGARTAGPEADQAIVVTGTHIRGASPAGSALRSYSRADVERTGATTIQDFARTLPENLSNVDTISNSDSNAQLAPLGGAGSNNVFQGSSFNLHGLGADATLTLLNGRRLAPAGLDGSIIDVSLIPLSAVERIDVLTDGASAIYGADAVAGVVNIVTRRSFSGAETSLRYGGAASGGAEEVTASQLLGGDWKTGGGLVAYQYRHQDALDASERSYIENQGGPYTLIPRTEQNSVLLSGQQEIGSSTKISGEALYSRKTFGRAVTSENDFQFLIASSNGHATQKQAGLELDHRVWGDWLLRVEGTYSHLQQLFDGTTTNVLAGSTRSVNRLTATSNVDGIGVLSEGTLFGLTSGSRVKAAFGASIRREQFGSTLSVGSFESSLPTQRRTAKSAFSELNASFRQSPDALPLFEISAAVRYDHYSDFGGTTNFKVGASSNPMAGLVLRANYGSSFRAPNLSQIGTPRQYVATLFPDSSSPTGFNQTVIVFGGNSNLKPEKSKSYTIGLDIKPSLIKNLVVSATYYHVQFRNLISTPPIINFNLGDTFTSFFVTRNPSLADVQAIYSSPNFLGDFSGTGLGAAGVGAILDTAFANIAALKTAGVDLYANYTVELPSSTLRLGLSANRAFYSNFDETLISSPFRLVNTFGQTPRLKGRADITWFNKHYSATAAANYVNAYTNTLVTPTQRIRSQLTEDLIASYDLDGPGHSALHGLKLTATILNLTNRRPPYVEVPVTPGGHPIPFDPANASPLGRFIAVGLTKRW
jgi:outer membrane receptor protein involved in Fe transport